jgi:hypothetical protein
MRKVVYSALNFLFYSNIWIGLGAAVQVVLTLRMTIPMHFAHCPWLSLSLGIGLATMSLYAWIRFEKLRQGVFDQDTARIRELGQFKDHLLFLACGSGLMAAYFLLPSLQHPLVWPILVVSLLLGIGYAQWPGGKPLRNRHWLKTLVVPLVWVFVTVLLPGIAVPTSPILLGMLTLERFCFIFAITVPFDLRDAKTDADQGIKTIANQFDARLATRIALGVLAVGYLIFVSIFLMRAQVEAEPGNALLGLATLIYTLTASLVWRLRTLHHDYWYSGVLDGLLVFWVLALI